MRDFIYKWKYCQHGHSKNYYLEEYQIYDWIISILMLRFIDFIILNGFNYKVQTRQFSREIQTSSFNEQTCSLIFSFSIYASLRHYKADQRHSIWSFSVNAWMKDAIFRFYERHFKLVIRIYHFISSHLISTHPRLIMM